MVRRAFNSVGLDIWRIERPRAERLPRPSAETVDRALAGYRDAFPLAPASGMTPAEAELEVAKYEWHYPFEFAGRRVPFVRGDFDRVRSLMRQRFEHVWPALLEATDGTLAGSEVLDVGCNSGFWSIQASRAGADRVVGIDASERNAEQANLVARMTGADGVQFHAADAYELAADRFGTFDVALFLGLLYHLERPLEALDRLFEVTRGVAIVDTELVNARPAMLLLKEDDVAFYHRQSHANRFALIPSEAAVVAMLRTAGFRRVLRVPDPDHPLLGIYRNGSRATFVAFR